MAASDVTIRLPSSHRLPTVSASQALRDLDASPNTRTVPTGLPQLDLILDGKDQGHPAKPGGGLPRGQICEVYGPPGVGKTALAMQMSANALRAGDGVVWVDCASPVAGPRLKQICSGSKSAQDLANLCHFSTPTLPHLLALLHHPVASFPPADTSLLVIDSISTVFGTAFPRVTDEAGKGTTNKDDVKQWASGRRWAVLGDFISSLGKLAALHNLAILVTSQTTTKVMSGSGAVLVPALTSTAWEGGVSSRIVLFRDWVQPRVDGTAEAREKAAKMRFAGVLKAGGIAYGENGVGRVIPFTIETDGLWEDELAAEPRELDLMPVPMPAPAPKKRKRTDAEIADSQSDDSVGDSDEDYGWADDEEAGGPTELVAPSSTTE